MSYEVSIVTCDLCGHEWTAVRPDGLVRLECPNCENMVTFENRMIPDLLVGFSMEDAEEWLRENGRIFRYTFIDNSALIGTSDYNPERVNLKAVNNVITEVSYE